MHDAHEIVLEAGIRKEFNIAKKLIFNSLRVCEFGITNSCTCRCDFCSIWKQNKNVFVNTNLALKAIDKLASLGVSHITLTGGEPLLHPNVVDFVRACTSKRVHCAVLNADARLVTEEKVQALQGAGVDYLCISIDSHHSEIVEQSRKIPRLMSHIENAVKTARKHKLKTMASVLIWKENYNRMQQLFDRINQMGFDLTVINYPEISESNVYPLGGEAVHLSKENIINSLEQIIRLKRTGKYNILNITSSMENIIQYLKNPRKVRYPCYGGYRVLFLDWFFDLYPCMHLPNSIGCLWELKETDLKAIECNECNMSWYRDFSVFFHGLRSLRPVCEALANVKFWFS